MTITRDLTDDDFWTELQSRFPTEGEFEVVMDRLVQPAMRRAYTQSRIDAAQQIIAHAAALGAPTGEYEQGYTTGLTHGAGLIS